MNHLLLQVVYPDGEIFRFRPGGALEIDLEDMLAKRLTAKGVGLFQSSAKVEAAFREAFKEVMFEFKDKVANP
jgi:hypothetical protein